MKKAKSHRHACVQPRWTVELERRDVEYEDK